MAAVKLVRSLENNRPDIAGGYRWISAALLGLLLSNCLGCSRVRLSGWFSLRRDAVTPNTESIGNRLSEF